MNVTITKIVKPLETLEGREQNQFAFHVKGKKECSYGIQKPEEDYREQSFKDKGLSQRKKGKWL